MTAAGRKRASGAVSDQPKSKKRVKVGNAEKGSKNVNTMIDIVERLCTCLCLQASAQGKQMLPPSERFVDQTAHKTSTRNHQNSLPAETDCSECFTVPNCSVACNVSCDGSDDCTAPEPCNDPSCEGDPCWEDDCENYDCTDQSCKANQCRIELCSQETCFEDINSLNHELYANISDPCWGLCQNPDQLLCLQDCVIDNPDASKPNAALGQEQTYSSCPTQNWNGYPFSHPDLLAYENSQNPSLQLRLPSASHTNQNQNINLPNHGTAPEMRYPSYDLNDLIAVTSASNLYSASLDSNPHSYIRDVRSQAVDNSARVSGTEFRSCWPTEKDFETLARASASTSNRLSVSTTVSSPLDMIAAAAELSAGMELPYPYMQQHSERQAEQAYLEAAPENSDKPNAPSLTAEKTLSGNGNICFCKWKTKKDGELGKFGLCNRQFDTEESLWIHVKSDHTSALINKYTCQWHGCARPGHFGTKSKLERHLLPHTGCK